MIRGETDVLAILVLETHHSSQLGEVAAYGLQLVCPCCETTGVDFSLDCCVPFCVSVGVWNTLGEFVVVASDVVPFVEMNRAFVHGGQPAVGYGKFVSELIHPGVFLGSGGNGCVEREGVKVVLHEVRHVKSSVRVRQVLDQRMVVSRISPIDSDRIDGARNQHTVRSIPKRCIGREEDRSRASHDDHIASTDSGQSKVSQCVVGVDARISNIVVFDHLDKRIVVSGGSRIVFGAAGTGEWRAGGGDGYSG